MRSFTTKMVSAIGSIALTAGLVGLSDPAVANTPAAREVHVPYGAADLGTPEKRAALRQRIADAGALVCRSDEASPDAIAQCRADAEAGARRALVAQLLASR